MREPSLTAASFPTARCDVCDKSTLTYVGLGEDGQERRLCARCDTLVASELEWVSADQLEAEGYYFGSPPRSNGGGCGSGCGTCSVRKNQPEDRK
jgi:hypothetical protein